MLDVGSGDPLVLIPGIQGRWEWMQPTIDALSRHWRVLSSSLPGEVGCDVAADASVDAFVTCIDRLLDRAGVTRAVICGVSFGGLVAIRYAAERPARVRGLILASTPGPRWKPNPTIARYMKRPVISSPLFFLGGVGRFWPELRVTYPDLGSRLRFCMSALARVAAAPAIPSRMSRRAAVAASHRFDADCARITAPTLVVTGERDLDQVVRFDETLEYVTLIDRAEYHLLDRTGHLGTVTAPERFADVVSRFGNRIAA